MKCPKCDHEFSLATKPLATGPFDTREEFVDAVWHYWRSGKSQNWIALRFKVANSTISRIIRTKNGLPV